MSKNIALSVLDQSIAVAGSEESQAIRDTIAMAQLCENLGYTRFWVSEHHNHASIVGTAPEILIAAMAAVTSRIRLGSAGVMLPHYSALHVAEQFRVLDAIAPGRIDLGVGRAPGSDGHTARALNPHGDFGESFPAQTRDLMAWANGLALPDGHPFGRIAAHPRAATGPDIWMLGSSDYGAQLAAYLGLPYAFAHFITDGRGAARALGLYRDSFQPSPLLDRPKATLCVWALAAETEEEARHLFRSRARWKLDRNRGLMKQIEAPDAIAFTPEEEAEVQAMWQIALAGSASQVADKLRILALDMQLDELVVLTWMHDQEARRNSYRLLAKEFGLTGAATPAY